MSTGAIIGFIAPGVAIVAALLAARPPRDEMRDLARRDREAQR